MFQTSGSKPGLASYYSGTGAVVFNAPPPTIPNSTISPDLIADFQSANVSKFKIDRYGNLAWGGTATIGLFGNQITWIRSWPTNSYMLAMEMQFGTDPGILKAAAAGGFGIASVAGATNGADVYLTRAAAATWKFGWTDTASPTAQSLTVTSVVAGTTDAPGANWTFKGSQGTGTGIGGDIIFQVAPATTTGSTQNALVNTLTVKNDASVLINDSARFKSANVNVANTSLNTIDSFLLNTFRAAEYTVVATDNSANNFQTSKILVHYDGGVATMSEYAVITSNTVTGAYAASSNATHALLQYTSTTSTNTQIKFLRTAIAI